MRPLTLRGDSDVEAEDEWRTTHFNYSLQIFHAVQFGVLANPP